MHEESRGSLGAKKDLKTMFMGKMAFQKVIIKFDFASYSDFGVCNISKVNNRVPTVGVRGGTLVMGLRVASRVF